MIPTVEEPPPLRLLVPRRVTRVPRDQGASSTRGSGGGLTAGTGKAHLRDEGDILLRVEDPVVEFPVGRTGLKVNAVSGISLDVLRGETLGVVGESGCGKSTTGRAIMQLPRPTSGSVMFEGRPLTEMDSDSMREAPRECRHLRRPSLAQPRGGPLYSMA